ncbi:unnamed protein product, partial [Adineta ricciae]
MENVTFIYWRILFLIIINIFDYSITVQINFYETHSQQYCLNYYVLNNTGDYNALFLLRPSHQIVPYCLDILEDNNYKVINYDSFYTFQQMKTNQITSENLIQWSAPISLAENYEKFLSNSDELSSSLIFYNCTKGWFGYRCEYTLYDNDLTFAELIREIVLERRRDEERVTFPNGTCYIHLQCNYGMSLTCLDWREICDGKRDCDDGVDEPQECLEREANECLEGYYRCHNGQCIPDKFYQDDDRLNPDCSDWTDVIDALDENTCYRDSTFSCEERTCSKEKIFPLGNGACRSMLYIFRLSNHNRITNALQNLIDSKLNSHLSSKCLHIMICLSGLYYLINNRGKCKDINQNTLQNSDCPSVPFLFPLGPVAFGHIYLVYVKNGSILSTYFEHRITPYLICYDKQLCGSIHNMSEINYNGFTCQYYFYPSDKPMLGYLWMQIMEYIYSTFRSCAPVIPLNCTNLFQCEQS